MDREVMRKGKDNILGEWKEVKAYNLHQGTKASSLGNERA